MINLDDSLTERSCDKALSERERNANENNLTPKLCTTLLDS